MPSISVYLGTKLAVCVAGALIYGLGNGKGCELGRLMFGAGLLAALLGVH